MIEGFDVPGMKPPVGIYSTAVWAPPAGRTLYISGQTGVNEAGQAVPGDIRAQTRQAIENLKQIVEYAGGTLADIVKLTVYVTSMSYFNDIHEVRAEYFRKPYPASTLVQVVALAFPSRLIEIEAVAVIQVDRNS